MQHNTSLLDNQSEPFELTIRIKVESKDALDNILITAESLDGSPIDVQLIDCCKSTFRDGRVKTH